MSKNYNFIKYEKCNVQGLRQVDFKSFIFLPPKILISEASEIFHLKIKTFGLI